MKFILRASVMYISLIIALVGVVLILLQDKAEAHLVAPSQPSILMLAERDFGITFLITGTVAFFFEVAFKSSLASELREEVRELLGREAVAQRTLTESGFISADEVSTYPFYEKISKAKEVVVVFGGSSGWLSSNAIALQTLMKKENSRTKFLLPDPTCETLIEELAFRFDEDVPSAKRRIYDAIDSIIDIVIEASVIDKSDSGCIEIVQFQRSLVYSCYLIDKMLYLVPYKFRAGKRFPPVLVFSQGSTNDYYTQDIQELYERCINTASENVVFRIERGCLSRGEDAFKIRQVRLKGH